MGLKNDIERAMLRESMSEKIQGIADLVGMPAERVTKIVNEIDFKGYIDIMKSFSEGKKGDLLALLAIHSEKGVEEATTQGTVNPNAQGNETPYQKARNNPAGNKADAKNDINKTAQAMQRLGKRNLGQSNAQQVAQALTKSKNGEQLSAQNKDAMATQAQNIDKLASDPKTASQFRQLLNRLNK